MEYEELKDAIRGLTKAQRRCLDNHGAGFAGGHPKTVEKLESLGLLAGRDKILGGGLPVKVREYAMPIRVNLAWCEVCTEEMEKRRQKMKRGICWMCGCKVHPSCTVCGECICEEDGL